MRATGATAAMLHDVERLMKSEVAALTDAAYGRRVGSKVHTTTSAEY